MEISMYLYADNMQRETWKFSCIFLAKVQTSTEIHAKRRQKIMNKAFFTFWKLLHSPMEFLETKSLYFSEYLSIWLRLVHQGLRFLLGFLSLSFLLSLGEWFGGWLL